MSVKVIVELKLKPGQRAGFLAFVDDIARKDGPMMKVRIGNAMYEVQEDPDTPIEIAEWESAEAHEAVFRIPGAAEAMAPMMDFLAEPYKSTIVRPLA